MKQKRKLKENLSGYLFITPSAVLLTVFVLAPIFMAFYLSLTDYRGMKAPTFIGFENFINALSDIGVQAALKNTLLFTVASVPLQIIPALLIAAVLAAKFRNRFGEAVRAVMFIPELCSATLIGTIFFYLFSADEGGFVNMLLGVMGIDKVNWLGSEATALGTIIFVNTWKSVGYYLVIFYAGIMDIPNSLYEASAIDGAGKVQQFFHVTVPNLKSVLFMVITVCTIWSFQIFDLTYAMTAGGPGYATTSLVYELYVQAFRGFKFGYANAIAVILFLLVLAMNLIQRIFLKDRD